MKEMSIDISGHTFYEVSEYIDQTWNYIITVCGEPTKVVLHF